MSKIEKSWADDVEVLIDTETLEARISALGQQITKDYGGLEPPICLVGILKGSFLFMADLARAIERHVTCEFIAISSYGDSTESSGIVQITRDLAESIEGKDVLIVEDIVDTGLTMSYLLENFKTRKPRSVKICSLLVKPENVQRAVDIDYIGFTIPNKFVVGYGLDYHAGRYRNLPFVGVYCGQEI